MNLKPETEMNGNEPFGRVFDVIKVTQHNLTSLGTSRRIIFGLLSTQCHRAENVRKVQ